MLDIAQATLPRRRRGDANRACDTFVRLASSARRAYARGMAWDIVIAGGGFGGYYAAGTLEPRHVVVPLREQLATTDLWLGRVSGAEPSKNCLVVDSLDGRRHHLHYDQLIVALGSTSRTLPIPGLVEHAIGFKTLSEAIALRNRVV